MEKADRKKTIEGLRQIAEYEAGKRTLRTKRVKIVVDVRAIRKKTGLTQEQFSDVYNIPLADIQNWEQGHRKPRGVAVILLKLIESDPKEWAVRIALVRKEGKI